MALVDREKYKFFKTVTDKFYLQKPSEFPVVHGNLHKYEAYLLGLSMEEYLDTIVNKFNGTIIDYGTWKGFNFLHESDVKRLASELNKILTKKKAGKWNGKQF